MVFVTAYLGGEHGTAKSARDFLRALLVSETNVTVISPSIEIFPNELGGKKLSIPKWIEKQHIVKLPRRFWKLRYSHYIHWQKQVRTHIQLKQLDQHSTVIINGWASYSYWKSFSKILDGKKILIVRESPRHFSGPDYNYSMGDMISRLSEFDELIFVSENVRQEWLQYPQLKVKTTYYLPNCCEEEETESVLTLNRDSVREKYNFKRNDFVMICPGSIEHRKGQDLLFEISDKLISLYPNIKIILIGFIATEWGKEFAEKVIAKANPENFAIWPSSKNILELLYACDLLVFPSRAEALPRTILEAMALKLPIVASDVDGIPELIENGGSGLIFKINDKNSLLNQLGLIIENKNLRETLALNAYKKYWNEFSRNRQFDRLKIILDSVTQS